MGPEELALYTQLCQFYTVTVDLSSGVGEPISGTRLLRPEPFMVHRIQWATTADTPPFTPAILTGTNQPSIQGRTVRCSFADSFTNFLGARQGMVSAVFGDSHGFLDLPKGIVFQGSQNIEVFLKRIFYPGPTESAQFVPPAESRWDFVWAGVSLLPRGVNQSGSE